MHYDFCLEISVNVRYFRACKMIKLSHGTHLVAGTLINKGHAVVNDRR